MWLWIGYGIYRSIPKVCWLWIMKRRSSNDINISTTINRNIKLFQQACEELAFIGSQPKEDWLSIKQNHAKARHRLKASILREINAATKASVQKS